MHALMKNFSWNLLSPNNYGEHSYPWSHDEGVGLYPVIQNKEAG